MTTAKPVSQPFTFDRAFDREAPGTTPRPVQRKMLTLDEIETLKRDAFAAGQRTGEQGHGKRQADAIAAVAEQIAALGQALESALQPARCDAVSLGYVTALKLARIALAKFPEDEIKTLIARCIEEQKTEPHLVLRVNNALLEPMREAAKGLAESSAFGGRIHVIGEPQIEAGDCQIEWADGGLTRNLDGALKQIEAVIRNYVFCAGGEPEKVPPPEKIMALSEETQLSIEGV